MKRIKKIASLLLAMTMVMAMTVPAFAADNKSYTITIQKGDTIKDETDHIYEAYQIFKGDLLEENDEKILSNIEWGSGVDGEALLEALKSNEELKSYFEGAESAADVAKAIGNVSNGFTSSSVNSTTNTDIFARVVSEHLTTASAVGERGATKIKITGAGYYLVKDQDTSVSSNGAYTRILLDVVGDTTVNVKSDVPTGDKKVYISTNENDEGYTVSDANYGATIGSKVSYVISSNVPNHIGYNYYYFIMNDTLSKGLTFDKESVAVTIGSEPLTLGEDYFLYTENVAPYTFRLAFKNIMEYTIGEEIVVTYSATINNSALIGVSGNENSWNLQYSNNPNNDYDRGDDTNNPNPGLPMEGSTTPLGKTPDEKTLTYLTELDITKYANEVSENNKLKNVEFTLEGTSYQVVLKEVQYYEVAENGGWYLLKDGTYTQTPPSTGDDYTYVKIGVGTDKTEKGYIKNAEGQYVVPEETKDYIDKDIYKRVINNDKSKYVDVNIQYAPATKTETEMVEVPVLMEKITATDGKISFKGLGEGTYTLTETFTPAGYNTIDPITFTIDFNGPDSVTTGKEECSWTISGLDDVTYNGGIFATDIINNSGSTLPSTGGIGTTIFYVIGGILVVGAGILLITKRRMQAQ